MTSAWKARAQRAFDGLDDRGRANVTGLALGSALYLVHFAIFSWWYIEDAAISFAYARNIADGEGFVAMPGAEWVEGFSNPTWTLALAGLDFFGITPWIAAKMLGALCGLATLPLAVRWFHDIRPDATPKETALVPLILATSLQFVLWNGSGLENSFFVLSLTASVVGLWDPRRVWVSGLAASVLAITRPEAPLYVAIIGFTGMWYHRRTLIRWALPWFIALLVPFLAWHAWRYHAFAWPFPNTYYAKLADAEKFAPLDWQKKGWKYIRNYAFYSGHGFLLPLYVAGAVGFRRPTLIYGAIALGGLATAALLGVALPANGQASAILATLALLGITLAALYENQGPRSLAWLLMLTAGFFALYSGGDWMKGYRWFSFAAVPGAVLLAVGIAEITPVFQRWPRIPPLIAGAPVVLGVMSTIGFVSAPETMPYDVYRRVLYMEGVKERLHLDHAALLDVDMGAHLWWSDFEIVDLAGLVDVPIGHHKWQHTFMREYAYQERNTEFAHVHGSAPRNSLNKLPEWKRYIEISAYPISPTTLHVGNHIRKDRIVHPWTGPTDKTARFQGNVDLLGLNVPAGTAPGEELYLELALQRPNKGKDFRVWVFLSNGKGMSVHELPPAYDWVLPSKWKADETWVGKYSLPIPADFIPGSYDLGIVVVGTGARSEVWAAVESSGTSEYPALIPGEVRWPGAVEVQSPSAAEQTADRELDAALQSASSGDCPSAEARWAISRRWLGRHHAWQTSARQRIDDALAACWALDAENSEDVESIRKARRYNHQNPETLRVSELLANRWEAAGNAATTEDARYTAWSKALIADPSRAWVRKQAEQSRDIRLGLSAQNPTEAIPAGGGGPD